jgi:UDP:flavonoid glycosyltransferase YjiC (YdhE family)
MVLVFYISGHGFGHASRAVELIDALTARRPDLRVIVRTNAHPWPLERVRRPGIEVQPFETDTGVAQISSLTIDEIQTATRAADFYRTFEDRVASEARYLKECEARIVVADIPPLAFAAAKASGIPSVAVANFTWDWIYAYYPAFESRAPGVISAISRAYHQGALALRLPIHGGFESMAVVEDIPLIARRSTRDPAETRRILRIDSGALLVLASFGGFGLSIPDDRLSSNGMTVLAPPDRLPDGLKHEDIVAAADVVVSKPGYGIVSECAAHRTPLLYTSRGRFAEYDVMVTEMPKMVRCRYITQEDLMAGNWTESVTALLAQSDFPENVRVDGAGVAAEKILGLTD